jgi:hypothetical protein
MVYVVVTIIPGSVVSGSVMACNVRVLVLMTLAGLGSPVPAAVTEAVALGLSRFPLLSRTAVWMAGRGKMLMSWRALSLMLLRVA